MKSCPNAIPAAARWKWRRRPRARGCALRVGIQTAPVRGRPKTRSACPCAARICMRAGRRAANKRTAIRKLCLAKYCANRGIVPPFRLQKGKKGKIAVQTMRTCMCASSAVSAPNSSRRMRASNRCTTACAANFSRISACASASVGRRTAILSVRSYSRGSRYMPRASPCTLPWMLPIPNCSAACTATTAAGCALPPCPCAAASPMRAAIKICWRCFVWRRSARNSATAAWKSTATSRMKAATS